jgi:hypothetical protein
VTPHLLLPPSSFHFSFLPFFDLLSPFFPSATTRSFRLHLSPYFRLLHLYCPPIFILHTFLPLFPPIQFTLISYPTPTTERSCWRCIEHGHSLCCRGTHASHIISLSSPHCDHSYHRSVISLCLSISLCFPLFFPFSLSLPLLPSLCLPSSLSLSPTPFLPSSTPLSLLLPGDACGGPADHNIPDGGDSRYPRSRAGGGTVRGNKERL